MNQITKLEYNLAPALTDDEKKYILSSVGDRIKNISKKDICTSLADLVSKAVFDAGQSIDELKLTGIINSIYPDLKQYFSTLTLKDIENAFRLGVREEYGIYMGVNPVTIFKWLKGYITDAKRSEAKKKQREYLESFTKRVVSDEEKKEIMVKACLDAFESVKRGENYNDVGNSVYSYLDALKLIPFTMERKLKYMEMAKSACKERMLNNLHSTKHPHEKNSIKERLKHIEFSSSTEVIIEAKKIALIQFFKDLIEMNNELKELL